MTNEELRTKIVEILEETEYEWTEEKNGYILQIFYDKLADALIAAGYGDVKDRKFEADHYWRMWQGSLVELERAEHRVEVAERALENACVVILSSRNGDQPRRLRAYYKAYLEAAEKELAEEGKDE